MTEEKKCPHVYQAIAQVAKAMSKVGIGKDSVAEGGGARFKFRGVDAVQNAIAVPLYEAQLVIIPRVMERTCTERATKSGGVASYVVLVVDFDFVSAVDGSMHTARTMGEAMDTSDKATNKAMSAAYKYVCFEVFCIPTAGENDSENHSHEKTSDSGRDLTGPLAASVKDWKTYQSSAMSVLRAAAKKGMGDLQEAWSGIYEEMRRDNPPSDVRKAITDAKNELKDSTSGSAHP